ncbi:hypothetical protein JW916_02765 [Candidatus Sumerlaeota bacterium]|nr:hypothetical protein [Candidatus Sumerlaeota bacterium]
MGASGGDSGTVDLVSLSEWPSLVRGDAASSIAALTYSPPRIGATNSNDLRARIRDGLDALFQADPEQAERLALLLSVLDRLMPEGADAIFEKIHRALQNFLDSVGGGDVVADTQQAAQAAAAQAQANTTTVRTEMVHFEIDIEVESSVDLSSVVAELSDQGIDVRTMRIQATNKFSLHIEFTGVRQEVQQSEPLVLDLNGDGVNLTGIADGQDFDIDADGRTDRTAFVQGDDAFVALDKNGNGRIDDGSELFGDQNGSLNGFEELARYDDNGDGAIDSHDTVYHRLRLLHDANGDGRVEANELSTLSEMGIASIDLRHDGAVQSYDDSHGNTLAERSAYTRVDGSSGLLVDAWLAYRTA